VVVLLKSDVNDGLVPVVNAPEDITKPPRIASPFMVVVTDPPVVALVPVVDVAALHDGVPSSRAPPFLHYDRAATFGGREGNRYLRLCRGVGDVVHRLDAKASSRAIRVTTKRHRCPGGAARSGNARNDVAGSSLVQELDCKKVSCGGCDVNDKVTVGGARVAVPTADYRAVLIAAGFGLDERYRLRRTGTEKHHGCLGIGRKRCGKRCEQK
jgi:hypothetical protein